MTKLEEGSKCPECTGTMRYPEVDGCSCHINPPCSRCVNNSLTCDECGLEEDSPDSPKPTESEKAMWKRDRERYEADRQRGHMLDGGGRIFDITHDGRSGSTMVFTGRYEGPVTAKDIFDFFGDGSFGHRGPVLQGGRFTYTKITD